MKRYIFLLIFLTLLVYLNTLGNSFVWDDLNNIVNNDSLGGPVKLKDIFLNSPPVQIFYRPISYLTIIFDHRLWGNNPFGYHLTNFLFHLVNAILIFYITARLTRSHLISFICSLLFAIHPVHTEAITYISGRSDPICGFFLFTAFLFYLKSLDTIGHRQSIYFGGTLSLFLLGLLSKEIAIIFPFAIFAYECLYSNNHFKTRFRRVMPFFAVLAAFLVFRYICVGSFNSIIDLSKVFLVPQIFLYYIRLLIFPISLHMQHRLEGSTFIVNMPFILSILIFAGIIFISLRLAKKRFMKFGLVFFFIGLLPFLGFLRLNAEIAEHWLYIVSFGFFLFLSGLFAQVKLLNKKITLPIVVLILSILTLQRNIVWRDDMSIYQDTLKYRPNDPKLHYNLGNAYLRNGLLNEAAKEYSIALKQNPEYAYSLNKLGLVSEKKGDINGAYQHYEKALFLDPGLDVAKRNLLRFQSTSLAFAQESYFDHSLYGEVLREFVDDGKVDYVALKNNPHPLDNYLRGVAKLDPEALNSMPEKDKIAFYINVYNALTLKVIADYYPVESIRSIPGVWDRFKFELAGKEVTLNNIEHDILRKEFKEPRIHFALICASRGCPELAREPFSGEDLDKQLDREAHKFINDKTKVRLDKDKNIFYLSSIFKWFKEDFGDVVEFISKYLPKNDVRFINERKPKIRYLDYDWSLNEKL